ncbi:hypothetical protein BKA56DRAFT_628146 [Ilyonectria sp. MPI-CAGE-AT-0026]|nr:hypothetical protein BKA56DRAFT_628146 [Ilyonectria sp. MPI-CAGE-AT-0026]
MAAVNLDPVMVPDDQDRSSSTQSPSKNVRTYHRYKDGTNEDERKDFHRLFLLTFDGKLGLALPNKSGLQIKRVLDLGTGTGIWAMEFGDGHPGVHVTDSKFVPPNVEFSMDDIDKEWNHYQPFDYIHSRMMTLSIANWRVYLEKIYE